MLGTFLATWIKLRRRALLGGTYLATAAITVLATSLTFVFADSPEGPGGPPGAGITSADLSAPSGLLAGLSASITLFGIVALCVAAATFASEYTTGTLRNLLIRQPHRVRLLGGLWAAVVSFTAGAVAVASLVAAGTALALAGSQGVDTSEWFTSEGLTTSLRTLGTVTLAAAGYATLGSALGILLRAPIPAVSIGFGYLFVVETIVAGTVDGSQRWLPGQLLSAVASYGTAEVAFTTALATVVGYLVIAAAASAGSFLRRDVVA